MRAPNPNNFLHWEVTKDLWDPGTKSSKYLNLGLSESALQQQKRLQHENLNIDVQTLTFGGGPTESHQLRACLARSLTQHLWPATPMNASHITITNGRATAVEQLSWLLCNPGDGILLAQHHFRAFLPSFDTRCGTKFVPVPFGDTDAFSLEAVACYEAAIMRAEKQKQPISALLMCNQPHNPAGRHYTREAIVSLMRLCEAHKIHLMSDESYALSTWQKSAGETLTPFTSVLTIDPTGIIHTSRLHLVWSISKDFGSNESRLDSIVSQSNAIHRGVLPLTGFSSCSSAPELIAANLLSDSSWLGDYVRESSRFLEDSYGVIVSWAVRHGISYAPRTSAALFFWVNLGEAYCRWNNHTKDLAGAEVELGLMLLRHKTSVGNESMFACEEPGWFRITFAYPGPLLEKGLGAIVQALKGRPRTRSCR